ncbi:MAG: choice-of-anchor Q domain-containing protein, partial [Planctomycetota bacterium]
DGGNNLNLDPTFGMSLASGTWDAGGATYDPATGITELTSTGQTWRTNALAYRVVDPGAATGRFYTIIGNDADSIWVLGDLSGFGGDTFAIHDYLPTAAGLRDAGNNADLPTDSDDIDGDSDAAERSPADLWGEQRVLNGTVDIGAYETRATTNPGGGVLYVDADVSGDSAGAGGSWANAFRNLRNALAVAQAGDQIWVAEGTYTPTVDLDRGVAFELVSDVALYGGFAGNEATLGARDFDANPTVLSGDLFGDDRGPAWFGAPRTDNSVHVLVNDAQTNVTISGFRVTGSSGTAAQNMALPPYGGGLLVLPGSTIAVEDCIFLANSTGYGGGVGTYGLGAGDSLTLTRCVISANMASGGGGLMVHGAGQVNVYECEFLGNRASSPGGGISIGWNNTTTHIENSVFSGNMAGYGGGMAPGNNAAPTVVGCSFLGNTATQYGGALDHSDGSAASYTNCVFYGNTATTDGDVMRNNDTGTPAAPSFTNCLVQGGLAGAGVVNVNTAAPVDNGGNIDADPAFPDLSPLGGNWTLIESDPQHQQMVLTSSTGGFAPSALKGLYIQTDLAGMPVHSLILDNTADTITILGPAPSAVVGDPYAIFDYHPLAHSPLLNRGANGAVTRGIDLDGTTRIQRGEVDIGAFETAPSVDARIYVDASAAGANDGLTWANAYTRLEAALNMAQTGTEIWVADGAYVPTDGADRSLSFRIYDGVKVYGGFTGGEATLGARGDWRDAPTILSGDLLGNDIDPFGMRTDNSFHVLELYHNNAVLDGFFITGGYADGTGDYENGGGIRIDNASGVTLSHLTISDNYAQTIGAGLYGTTTANLLLRDVLFLDNYTDGAGGGAQLDGGSGAIVNAVFDTNTAGTYGGGLRILNADYTVANSVFFQNDAWGEGGGAALGWSASTFVNCTFHNNTATLKGGALSAWEATPRFDNCILHGNTAAGAGTGDEIFANSGGAFAVTVTNSFVQGGVAGTKVSENGNATVTDNGGNIEGTPGFVNPFNADGADDRWWTADDGLRIQQNAVTQNTGANALLPADAGDLDNDADTAETLPADPLGNARVQGGLVDMGAYESANTAPAALTLSNDSVAGNV